MKEYYYNTNQIYYRKNDFQTDRLTIVLVHGVCGSSSAWWEYEKIFENKYNILSYDIRGHGKSKRYKNKEDYKISEFSKDLFELTNYLNINKFVIISHSFGTFISLNFIDKYSKKINGAIFLSPNYNPLLMPQSKIAKPLFNLFSKIKFPISNIKKRKHLNYLKDYSHSGDFNIKRTCADVSNTGLRAYLYTIRQSLYFNGEKILAKIDFSVLIIHGKDDTIFPIKYGEMMSEKIKNSKIVKFDNVCHEIKDSKETISKISSTMGSFLKML